MILSISLFGIINVVIIPDPNISISISPYAAYGAGVNPNSIKIALANGLGMIFVKNKQAFSKGPRSLLRS